MSGYIGDSLPERGRFDIDKTGFVNTMPGDERLNVVFYKHPVINQQLSLAAGSPQYEDKDYVRIQQPGESHTIVIREASAQDKARWARQWHQYSQGKDQTITGTPLALLFPANPAFIANLQSVGMMTVEQVANASASAIDAMGMHGQDAVNYAQKFLAKAASGAEFHKVHAELEQEKRKSERLQEQMDELLERFNRLSTSMHMVGIDPTMQPQMPPAQPYQPAPMRQVPRPDTFASTGFPSFGADAQSEMINANHGSGEEAKRKGGWPKGKPRK